MTYTDLDRYVQGCWVRDSHQLAKVRKLQHTIIKMLGNPTDTKHLKEIDLYKLITDKEETPVKPKRKKETRLTEEQLNIIRRRFNLR